MCGICGFLTFDRQLSTDDEAIIRKMNSTLIHRGPDAQDTLLRDNLALGFTRLSIIGLDNGMQPIFSEDGSIALVCNGEIFNYPEWKSTLQSQGHTFRTASDVEVIIHLYEEYGTDFLNRLNGQFAFALYDSARQLLFCARDQLGIIPFFYTCTRNTFIFGSEIKAILQHPFVRREPDLVGLDQVFTFAGLISPRTMFKDINSLENGHFLLVERDGRISNTEYWDLCFPEEDAIKDERPESYYLEKLEALLDQSIRFRLRADVPFGLYLSGGLDSSLIAKKIDRLSPGVEKHAFSIDFIESQHSESNYQQSIAKEAHFRLNQKTFFYSDISDRLANSIYHSECPIKETYNTASLSLSESVRAKDIKVILSGEGADEFFAGYVGYRFDKMRAMQGFPGTCTHEEEDLRERLWGDNTFHYEHNFLDFGQVKRNLYSDSLNAAFNEIDCLNYPIINKQRIRGRHILHKRAYIDYKIRLVDHLVSDHGDRMALANSVEVRYPFLDKELVEFSTLIPPDLKLRDFTEKYILKQIAGKYLPNAISKREKFHFIAPGSPYLLQKAVPYICDLLSYDQIKKQGYFNPDQVEALKRTYSQDGFTVNAPYESDLLITVITFGILLDKYFN
jgi:asparagine synthase (glutamine-hydrolysing)